MDVELSNFSKKLDSNLKLVILLLVVMVKGTLLVMVLNSIAFL